MKQQQWYESWFDSPYYHILYKNRDGDEARRFLDNLISRLELKPGSRLLDLCCGKGRHSLYLNSVGFVVTGIDLSPRNIRYCRQFENETLEFYVHDMRSLFRVNYFHAVLNLFTSFGYFEREHDNELSVVAAARALVPGGYLIIDFMNAYKVVNNLKPYHNKEIDGIHFHIHKEISNGFIYKAINFTDSGTDYSYREEVKVLQLEDFERYMKSAGLVIKHIFGNYNLEPFMRETSSRLIIVAQK